MPTFGRGCTGPSWPTHICAKKRLFATVSREQSMCARVSSASIRPSGHGLADITGGAASRDRGFVSVTAICYSSVLLLEPDRKTKRRTLSPYAKSQYAIPTLCTSYGVLLAHHPRSRSMHAQAAKLIALDPPPPHPQCYIQEREPGMSLRVSQSRTCALDGGGVATSLPAPFLVYGLLTFLSWQILSQAVSHLETAIQ